MLPQIKRRPVATRAMVGAGLFLIICGLIKKVIVADYISGNFVDRVFDNPALYTGLENLLAVYGFTLQLYCDFSGYSDMAIGLALLLGFHLRTISMLRLSRRVPRNGGAGGIYLCRHGCATICIFLWEAAVAP